MKVYLAGYINSSVMEQCVGWRKKIRQHYESWPGGKYPVDFLDPINGEDFTCIKNEGLYGVMPPHAIVHKDYTAIEKSDLIVANMNTFGQTRSPAGTICELAWAWQMHKAIVLITDENSYINHPFINYFASWIVSSVEDLLEKKIINQFYKAWNPAQY